MSNQAQGSNAISKTQRLTGVAIFTAIVIVLQLLGSFIRFGTFSISLVLIPIVIGTALYGAGAGAWLGFVFGLVVLLSGDANLFLTISPIGTILVVLVKGAAAGALSGLAYKAVSKTNETVGTIVAAIVCPVVNTGVFLLGCCIFFLDTITQWANGTSVGVYMIATLVGLNFVFELVVNLVLSSVIVRLIKVGKKSRAK